jgi:hypothetical protein
VWSGRAYQEDFAELAVADLIQKLRQLDDEFQGMPTVPLNTAVRIAARYRF